MIPFLERHQDPNLYSADAMVALYRSYSVLAFQLELPFVRLFGLQATYLALHAASLIAFFWAVITLTRCLTEERSAPSIAVLLLLLQKYVLGGVYTYDSYLLSRHLAFPFLLWAIVAVMRQRWVTAAILCGLGFSLHPVIGLSGIAVSFLLAAPSWRELRSRRAGVALFCLFLASLPALLARMMAGGEGTLRLMDEHWVEIVRIKNSAHFFLSAYDTDFIVVNAAVVIALGLAATTIREARHRMGILLLVASVPLAVLFNFLFTEVWPVQLFMLASPMRIMRFVTVLAGVAGSAAGVRLWRTHPQLRWLVAGAMVVFATRYQHLFFFWVVLALAVAAGVELRFRSSWQRLPSWLPAAIGATAIALSLRRPALALWDRYPEAAILVSCVAIVALLEVARPRLLTPTTLLLLLCSALLWKGSVELNNGRGILKADLPVRTHETHLTRAAGWARDNTPSDALFVVDPALARFRPLAQRSLVATAKEGTYSNLSRDFAFLWKERMQAVCRIDDIVERPRQCNYRQQDTAGFLRLAEETKATHLLVERTHQTLELPLLFENERYRIHSIESR